MTTTDVQGSLFQLPAPAKFPLTGPQREVLDWLAFVDATTIRREFPPHLSRPALRNLIAKELVALVAPMYGRYRITEMGRLARTRSFCPK